TEAARKREAAERSKADDNFREATRAKEREAVARGDAEENFRQAKQAVDEMLTEVGLTELAAVPAMTPTQRRLLEKALHFYEGLLDKRSADPEVRRELARACMRVGDINQTLGLHAEAERSLARALALLVNLTEDFPDYVDYRLAVAETKSSLGWVLA